MLMWLLNLGFAGGTAPAVPVEVSANAKFNLVFERADRTIFFESEDRNIVVS
jgi:hypothetical protein